MTESSINPIGPNRNQQVEALARGVFGDTMNLDEPILGLTDDTIIAANITEFVAQPDNTVATLIEDEKVVGFSLAIPIGKMDPTRAAESANTAYIYFTAIDPARQGQGLVGPLMKQMVEELKQQGYSYVERDSVLDNGYADKAEARYKEAIIDKYDHDRWAEVGPERFFRLDLHKM